MICAELTHPHDVTQLVPRVISSPRRASPKTADVMSNFLTQPPSGGWVKVNIMYLMRTLSTSSAPCRSTEGADARSPTNAGVEQARSGGARGESGYVIGDGPEFTPIGAFQGESDPIRANTRLATARRPRARLQQSQATRHASRTAPTPALVLTPALPRAPLSALGRRHVNTDQMAVVAQHERAPPEGRWSRG